MGMSREEKRAMEARNRLIDKEQREARKKGRKVASNKPDIDGAKAARMSAKDILKALKQGKTVSGYDQWMVDNYGAKLIRDVPLKEIEKRKKMLGDVDAEGTYKTKRTTAIGDSARELFSNKRADPPPGRTTWW